MFIVILLLSFSSNLLAHDSIYVRVFDLKGNRISKGHVHTITDSSLQLKEGQTEIKVRNIGFIKTKHSGGINVIAGSLIGMLTGAIVGVAASGSGSNANSGTSGFQYNIQFGTDVSAAAGAFVGLGIGAAVGGLTALAKNPKFYLINGDSIKWKSFQIRITGKSEN